MVVLGISLGSRTTGIAVIKDKELLVARSLTLRKKDTTNHCSTLQNCIQQYKIMMVVIKMPPVTHISERLKELLAQCLALFQYHGCMVEVQDTKTIKAVMPDIRNKPDLIAFATQCYPDLVPLEAKERTNKQKYHEKMFEAVVIAHLKSQERSSP